ncbi:anchored repeat-type ABC transporter ATP-binding subunit [Boudabousia marimammalium]|uniref:Anchored repeat-type ABC transporter ATP-binding subunit n=1 Tax=Boudabousia marimammalium TaxID=156892 RepID=A0A1Q5PSV3_9ACTO|nr:anchored repeat-type ABC transporter ATP-binding subunit [Boudabousia marimammalium]OKL50450.1 anchored repeat-type ABC transporter ATP-binding subunit [Boudabousia marimammalium]
MTEPVLEIRGLNVSLSGRRILRDVDLTCEKGELLGLLGPNGAGKTTMLRTMMGLVMPTAGSIKVQGMTGKKAADLIGYVPQRQDIAWEFPVTVAQLVMTGRGRRIGWLRSAKTEDWQAVFSALEQVQMRAYADRPIAELSGGQRQRILIARALVNSPALLVLDEPFTGLDMPTQELLSALFRQLTEGGTSLLMTTHDLTHAMVICDRVALLNRAIVAEGAPSALRDPQVWMDTFRVSAASPLLKQLGI